MIQHIMCIVGLIAYYDVKRNQIQFVSLFLFRMKYVESQRINNKKKQKIVSIDSD